MLIFKLVKSINASLMCSLKVSNLKHQSINHRMLIFNVSKFMIQINCGSQFYHHIAIDVEFSFEMIYQLNERRYKLIL